MQGRDACALRRRWSGDVKMSEVQKREESFVNRTKLRERGYVDVGGANRILASTSHFPISN